uniref:Uncharacterized protein n=1 Tax=Clytia hemisphaerica TaxID=252671 RepID=A0A7M5XGE3_9CNID
MDVKTVSLLVLVIVECTVTTNRHFADRRGNEVAPTKRNTVQFRDSAGKTIATLKDPRNPNDANVTLSKNDDMKRYIDELQRIGLARGRVSKAPVIGRTNDIKQENHVTKHVAKKDDIEALIKKLKKHSSVEKAKHKHKDFKATRYPHLYQHIDIKQPLKSMRQQAKAITHLQEHKMILPIEPIEDQSFSINAINDEELGKIPMDWKKILKVDDLADLVNFEDFPKDEPCHISDKAEPSNHNSRVKYEKSDWHRDHKRSRMNKNSLKRDSPFVDHSSLSDSNSNKVHSKRNVKDQQNHHRYSKKCRHPKTKRGIDDAKYTIEDMVRFYKTVSRLRSQSERKEFMKNIKRSKIRQISSLKNGKDQLSTFLPEPRAASYLKSHDNKKSYSEPVQEKTSRLSTKNKPTRRSGSSRQTMRSGKVRQKDKQAKGLVYRIRVRGGIPPTSYSRKNENLSFNVFTPNDLTKNYRQEKRIYKGSWRSGKDSAEGTLNKKFDVLSMGQNEDQEDDNSSGDTGDQSSGESGDDSDDNIDETSSSVSNGSGDVQFATKRQSKTKVWDSTYIKN